MSDHIFRQYDIRGIFGDDLTVEVAEALGRAYAVLLRRKGGAEKARVSVGRDVRKSSARLRDALVRGLTSAGLDCLDLGECPTPLQYFSIHSLGLDGGIMITGSHNPPEYNGFKISVGKETIHGEEIQELKEIMREEPPPAAPAAAPGSVETTDIISRYIDWVADNINVAGNERPVKVVIDAGNGTAGLVAPKLLRRLGCEVTELFCDPDGSFPNHHPDPTVEENLSQLIDSVKREGADFGVGYDGDGDRIGVVDEKGSIIWGDQLMIIFSRSILRTMPGATVVGEVKCSQVMYDEIEKAGGRAVMWKTGHSLIKSRMKELKAAMAGEMSGHIFFADRFFGFDDAIYSTCRLIEILAEKRVAEPAAAFSDLLAGVPATSVTPEMRVDCPDELKFSVIERLSRAVGEGEGGRGGLAIRDVVTIDGLRIIFDGGWALVRASNTQPVLVLRFEAESPQLLEKIKDFMKGRLLSVWPQCRLPY
ncbi:MAG TPA: phosphomannomutase/phosphoglucomutase [Deltaproteobacteria bacterium]|nr:phosphomannomutase/phosphoglucomutase [Deltaproteobacteria bacterium]